jgi:hypothetical protein
MRRAFLAFLLILSVGFQGIALAGRTLGSDRSGDTAHSMLHAEAVAHHHDHDGRVHKDSSDESKRHVQPDGFAQVAAVLPSASAEISRLPVASMLVSAMDLAHDSPFLEGLKRPPR